MFEFASAKAKTKRKTKQKPKKKNIYNLVPKIKPNLNNYINFRM